MKLITLVEARGDEKKCDAESGIRSLKHIKISDWEKKLLHFSHKKLSLATF